MALTFKLEENAEGGNLKVRRAKVTFDSSYDSGGEAVTAADFGLSTLVAVIPVGGPVGYSVQFDPANSKLVTYRTGTSANTVLNETTAAVNLSAVSYYVVAIGY